MSSPPSPALPQSAQVTRISAPAASPNRSNESHVPLLESNFRILQSLESYVKLTWLPELEAKVNQLKDHDDERRRLEEKDKAVSAREVSVDKAEEEVSALRAQVQAAQRNLAEEAKAVSARKQEVDSLEQAAKTILTALTSGTGATLPTPFRGEFAAANVTEWLSLNVAQPLSTRLRVLLEMLGVAEDIKSKELYLAAAVECYKVIQEIDRAMGVENKWTKKLADVLSQRNVFDYRFRIPTKGQPVDHQWMTGPAGVVGVVEHWAVVDISNNGKKALVK